MELATTKVVAVVVVVAVDSGCKEWGLDERFRNGL